MTKRQKTALVVAIGGVVAAIGVWLGSEDLIALGKSLMGGSP